MFLLYIIICIIVCYLIVLISWKKHTSMYGQFFCPRNNLLLGTVLFFESDPHKLFKQFCQIMSSNNTVLTWLSWKPVIFSSSAQFAEVILSSREHIKKSYFYSFSHEWLGTGLLTSHGDKWKSRRRMITPSFHFAILKSFTSSFEEDAQNLVDCFESFAGKSAIDIQPYIRMVTLQSICKNAMGIQLNLKETINADFVRATKAMTEELQYRQKSPWLWLNIIYFNTASGKRYRKSLRTLHDFSLNLINKRIAQKSADQKCTTIENSSDINNDDKYTFLDSLLALYSKGEIDKAGICEEVDTFMFEGHDTTSSAISWCLYLLGRHPEYQTKLQYEIDNSLGGNITDKMHDLTFLDYVVKETLRLYPPLPVIGRCLEKDVVVNGKKIFNGTEVFINITMLHRNPKYWNNPDQFNPYRFAEKDFYKRHPYSYVPFSAGTRNCVGQRYALLEFKIFIYTVLKNYRIKSIQAPADVETAIEIVTSSRNGLFVEFEKR